MATATLELADGTKVTIEGTHDEVAALLQRFHGGAADTDSGAAPSKRGSKRRRSSGSKTTSTTRASKGAATGATAYIRELVEEDYFKTKRGLADVQATLEERAHIYPVTTLSPSLFRLVKAKELRRIKEGGAWKYVNP